MKNIFLAFVLALLSTTAFAAKSATVYPFEAKISGHGRQTILFIPGFTCSGDEWNETRARYEKDFRCITLTMAGFAGVPAQPGASFANWEKAIAAYIKEQKIDQPIIVGHSMGGGLALALAADYPELCGKIVVVDALPCLMAITNPAFKVKENNDCSPVVKQFTVISDEQFYKMQKGGVGRLCADTSRQAQIVSWSMKSDRATFAQMFCDFSNTDLREKIANIKCPNLILLEAYFVNLMPQIAAQYKKLDGANLKYATKGLHFIMYDDTDWYNQQLDSFIH
ncbi:alpha/beta fold hydrolase [Chitinophaga vietnamensis]|uniref:alpha/beta fold hydrolase n=1 Tax=Chitinophaga vietnamensis TaxID=2593957 RepID=UPI001178635A|nr:alpha/beta hydrolase [Chitinophaga vietnamensis]